MFAVIYPHHHFQSSFIGEVPMEVTPTTLNASTASSDPFNSAAFDEGAGNGEENVTGA